MTKRADIEAKRGIFRNEEGKIIRSKEWKLERIAYLKTKKADLLNRIKNIDSEISQHSN